MSDLSGEQLALAESMSALSEEAWYAGWMDGLEVALWDAVVGGPRSYGRLEITTAQIERLRELADAAGGWIVLDAATEETFVPMEAWLERYVSTSTQTS